jgi:hypothetical protein
MRAKIMGITIAMTSTLVKVVPKTVCPRLVMLIEEFSSLWFRKAAISKND